MARVRLGASLMDRDERDIGVGAKGEVDARVGNVAEIVGCGGALYYASDNEDSSSSEAVLEEAGDAHASCDKSSCTYCFGASMITIDRIRKMEKKGYFAEGEA
jgi:hypothetical protein